MPELEVDQLRRTASLIAQPYLLEVLVAAASGETPSATIPDDADPASVEAAVNSLTEFGAVFPTGGSPDEPLALTARGQELLGLLQEVAHPTP